MNQEFLNLSQEEPIKCNRNNPTTYEKFSILSKCHLKGLETILNFKNNLVL
jgi:hypothetical protein